MAFTKIAESERKRILAYGRVKERLSRGWYVSNVGAALLDELGIKYEVEDSESAYIPGREVYAPVWVYGVWLRGGMPTTDCNPRWDIVKRLLIVTRDSLNEQKMVTAELSLEGSVASSVRMTARNLLEVLHGDRKAEVSDEHS